MQFGEIIKEAREKKLLSQEDAAKLIEKTYTIRLSASYLSMIESGARTNITMKVLRSLLHFYMLPLSAAASLFYETSVEQPKVAEACSAYQFDTTFPQPKELEALPPEAKRTIRDFMAFMLSRYNSLN